MEGFHLIRGFAARSLIAMMGFVPVFWLPTCLKDRSKYERHQGVKEMKRRSF